MDDTWAEWGARKPVPDYTRGDGQRFVPGDRVCLRPGKGADLLDLALVGKTARIESIEQDFDGQFFFAVTVEDDPGQDLGVLGQPGHRFFFRPEEVDSLGPAQPRPPRVLVAGVGNIFFGDDAFGVEVVRLLVSRPFPAGVTVKDFGIRGFDLACALVDGFAGVILVDAVQRGGPPGTLYVIEPTLSDENPPPEVLEGHGLHPAKVLALARSLGEICPWIRILGCEPLTFGTQEEPALGLSASVVAAVPEAVRLVEELVGKCLDSQTPK